MLIARGMLIAAVSGLLLCSFDVTAGFRADFDSEAVVHDPTASDGWAWMAGDGEATVAFTQEDGIGRLEVDARTDRRNIWWAFIRRSISAAIDREALARPDRELRVEARVRASAAPRRINLHFNHSRTTDFHSHLMEYDLPDTENWHRVSLTTKGFDARPGDEVYVQLALMDWGREQYLLEIDYLEVSVVDPAKTGADLGRPLPYRPPVPPLGSFTHALPATETAMVDSAWPETNFQNWGSPGQPPLAGVGGSKLMLVRFEPADHAGAAPSEWGALALHVTQLNRADTDLKDFGVLRVVEVLAGDPAWRADTVSWRSFLAGDRPGDVLNGQMMVDVKADSAPGGRISVPVSPPVLERLLSGRSLGLAVLPQGAIEASFHRSEGNEPTLYFNTAPRDQ